MINEKERKFNFIDSSKLNPLESLLFEAHVLKGQPAELDKIKKFILQETNVRLVFQTRSERYLKIVPGNAENTGI
jgi:hypothetical protein